MDFEIVWLPGGMPYSVRWVLRMAGTHLGSDQLLTREAVKERTHHRQWDLHKESGKALPGLVDDICKEKGIQLSHQLLRVREMRSNTHSRRGKKVWIPTMATGKKRRGG